MQNHINDGSSFDDGGDDDDSSSSRSLSSNSSSSDDDGDEVDDDDSVDTFFRHEDYDVDYDDENLSVEEKRVKMATLLEIYGQLPVLVREEIDKQVNNVLVHTKRTVHRLITETNYSSVNYQGLDGDRDTHDEVETAVRFFPGVLSTKCLIDGEDEYDTVEQVYPIVKIVRPFSLNDCWRCNIKAIPFTVLIARLGTEIGQLQEEERGGLVPTNYQFNYNVMQLLAYGIDRTNKDTTEHQQLVHNLFRVVLQQLKDIGLMKKDDIMEYDLVRHACRKDDGNSTESRLRFFIDWDPASLARPGKREGGLGSRNLPLHNIITLNGNIQWFQSVFKAGIVYFPKKRGMCLLFRKDIDFGHTPFQLACEKFGRDEVVKVVENTIADYYSGNNNNNTIIPYNPVDAFLTAVSDKSIHLNGAYFFLRRHPDILQKLVSSSAENNEGITRTNDNNNTGLMMNITTTTTTTAVAATTNPKKRKRNKNVDNDKDADDNKDSNKDKKK